MTTLPALHFYIRGTMKEGWPSGELNGTSRLKERQTIHQGGPLE